MEISDTSGSGASGFLNIIGSLTEVKIISPGIGYQQKPSIKLIGGNGSGAIIDCNLVRSQINSGFKGDGLGVNPTTDTITFFEKHNFDNGEEVIYNPNENARISPLQENAIYIVGVLNYKQIKLYESKSDAFNRTNNINLVGISSGFHYFKTVNSKNTITRVYVKDSGSGYSNKKIKVPSVLSFDGITNGVNTFDDYIFAENHNLKEKDVVVYNADGTEITGLSTSSEYYVSILDKDRFQLSAIGIGTNEADINYNNRRFVKLESIGTGIHEFAYPPISLSVESLSGIAATTIIEPELEPIVLGSIQDVFLESNGVGYGVSNIINFHKRPDIRIKPITSSALLKPIVINGSIVDVQFLSFGGGYDKGVDIVVSGKGSFADLRPVIENGRVVAVNIINGGVGYGSSDTTLDIKRRGQNAKFLGNVFEWKINQIEKNKDLLSTQDEGLIVPSKNKDLGLQFIYFNAPKSLRKIIKDHIDDSNREVFLPIHSPIIGWAYDGNPIYGPYGQVGKEIKKIRSSYSKKIELNKDLRPDFPGGFFAQDYYYDRAVGDLDEHNGRFCKTPEFPNGVYAYFATINDDQISLPEYPYVVGETFKNHIIEENTLPSFTQDTDLSKLNLIRNIGPYYTNSANSSYKIIQKNEEKYKQEFTITKTLASNIDKIKIYSPGQDYKVGDNIIFDNINTGGTGASAAISRVRGKDLSNIVIGVSTYNDTQFYTESNRIVGITQLPHNLKTEEKINVTSISNSRFSFLEGIKSIFVKQKTSGITSDIPSYDPNQPTIFIDVSDTSGFEVDDFISIGLEILKITNIYPERSQLLVNRIENQGIHTVGIDVVTLLPNKFYFIQENLKEFNKKNKVIYFSAKYLIGYGSTGSVYSINNNNVVIPERSIYSSEHGLYNGQEVTYNVGIGGTGLLVSPTTNPAQAFRLQDNQKVYIVNRGRDLVGLSTVGFTTLSGIGSNFNSLYFLDDVTVTGYAHSLTTQYPLVTGRVENYFVNAQTADPHNLEQNDKIVFNITPKLTETIKLKYDLNLRKITTDIVYFNALDDINDETSEIYLPNNNFQTGEKVVYYSNGTTEINGLVNNKTYYVIKNDPNYIRLSDYKSDSLLGIGVTITGSVSEDQGIALINPPLIITKNNAVTFDLSDISLSGMDLKLYQDENLRIELESYKYNRNTIESGSAGAELKLDTTSEIPNALFYNLIPFSPVNPEKYQISSDQDVNGNNKIIIQPSKFNDEYPLVSVEPNNFKINLNQKPEYVQYNVDSGISSIFYDTNSRNANGPISGIKLNFGGRGYKKIPKISRIDSINGKNGILKAESSNIGKIDSLERIKDGFDYPTDITLTPVLSSPTICQVNGISRIGYIGIVTSGKNYIIPPKPIVVGNSNIELTSEIQGGTVSKVNIITNVNNLTSPLTVLPTRNSNGFDIDDIVYDSISNTVTLELVNNDNQRYPLVTSEYGGSEIVFPFKVGDQIFVENCKISNSSTKNNYNSKDWGYKFFTITGISTVNYTVTYSMTDIGTNLGEYITDFGYGYVTNRKIMAEFEMVLFDDLGYYSNELVLGYDSLGNNVFSAKVMENGWDDGINQLRLIDSAGELNVGDRLVGTNSRLNGFIESVNQFNLNSNLNVFREKVNDFGDRVGNLNDYQQRLSDNDYYQKFSYSIKSDLPYEEWRESVRSLVHPAGFKEFCDLDVFQSASNNMTVGVNTSAFGIQVNVDNEASVYSRYNFTTVIEDEQNDDGSVERVLFPEGVNLTSYVLSKTNKVIKIDDISDQFTGFTTTTGGQIVGLSTFKLTNKNISLFYREFNASSPTTVNLVNNKFEFINHNFQSGQKLIYKLGSFNNVAIATATSVVDESFTYPPLSSYFDSPIYSFDSGNLTFDSIEPTFDSN